MRTWLIVLLITVVVSPNMYGVDGFSSTSSETTSISLQIDFGNETMLDFEELSGDNVYEVTDSVVEIEVDWYGNLVYVHTIEGVSNSQEEYWQYWVDGEYATEAANTYSLRGNETIVWRLTSALMTSESSDFDESLLIGIPVVSLLGIVILVVLYWIGLRRKGNF